MSASNESPIPSTLVEEDPSYADLVVTFVEQLGETMSVLENAMSSGDFEAIQTRAHQLKGAAGGYGYPILTETAAILESGARDRQARTCTDAIAELRGLCARVVVQSP